MKKISKKAVIFYFTVIGLLCFLSVVSLTGLAAGNSEGSSDGASAGSSATPFGLSSAQPLPFATFTGNYGTCEWSFDSTTGILSIFPSTAPGGNSFPTDPSKTISNFFDSTAGGSIGSNNIQKVEFINGTMTTTFMQNMFLNMSALQEVSGLSLVDTSSVENMSEMFSGCSALTSLDFTGLNTPNLKNMSNMFNSCTLLSSIEFDTLDTSNVTDMSNMFYECQSLTVLDLDTFFTDKVTTTQSMFYNCINLKEITFPNWNTSSVTNMSYMFYFCGIETASSDPLVIDVSGWITSSVEDMSYMFYGSTNLREIDVSSWNTANVENMSYMFYESTNLRKIDVSSWNTSSVEDMSYMFYHCSGLMFDAPLDVSGWVTSNVRNMSYMFYQCEGVNFKYLLDVSGWNTSKVKDMSYMFYYCQGIGQGQNWGSPTSGPSTINVEGWDVSSVENMSNMFYSCFTIETLDVSNWKTDNLKDASYLFASCNAVTDLDVSNWETSQITTMAYMFNNCSTVNELDVSQWNTSQVEDMDHLFAGCSTLTELDVSQWKTESAQNMEYVFSACKNVLTLDVSNFDTTQVTTMSNLFAGCEKVAELDVSKWKTTNVINMSGVFSNCKTLEQIDVTGWQTSNVNNMSYMFYNCSSFTELNVLNFNTTEVTDISRMFGGCIGLTTLNINHFDMKNVEKMNYTFSELTIEELNLSNWETPKLWEIYGIFRDSAQLRRIDISKMTYLYDQDPFNDTDWYAFEGTYLQELRLGNSFYISPSAELGNTPPLGYTVGWSLENSSGTIDQDLYIDSTAFASGYNNTTTPGIYFRSGIPYTIRLEGNGGIGPMGVASEDIPARYFDPPIEIKNNFSKIGYEFICWNTSADGLGTSFENEEKVSNLTTVENAVYSLYAQWKAIPYTVTFDVNGGTGGDTPNIQTLIYQDFVAAPTTIPTLRAFKISGWFKEKECINQWNFAIDTMPAENITLYAGWERTDWEVFFDANGGSTETLPKESLLVPLGKSMDINIYQPGFANAPSYSKNALLGWKDQNGLIIDNSEYIPKSNIHLVANWTPLAELITRKKENVVTYKDESTVAEIENAIGANAEYTDYLGVLHSYPVLLDLNPLWLTEGGVNEIKMYLSDPVDAQKVYGNAVSYLYVLNRPYINGNREIWIFEGETINPYDNGVYGYGEMPNFEKKRIDRGNLDLIFNADAVNIWEAGTYWASYSGGFQDYDLKQSSFNFPVIVHVMKRKGLTREEKLHVKSSDFWVKVTEIYHLMKPGQIIDINPSNYQDGGALRSEEIPAGGEYDRQLNVTVGEYVIMSPNILNILDEEESGQINIMLNGRSWIFSSNTTDTLENNYPRGYYDLRMDFLENEEITKLIGENVAQMQLHFNMNRSLFATPTFVVTPNDAIKSSLQNGTTPYLFHYNNNTNELELIGAMTFEANGNLSIPMNGVYKDYVILTSLPENGNYRITESTNVLSSKTYDAIINNQIDSGHILPSGNALNGISTNEYMHLLEATNEKNISHNERIFVIGGISMLIIIVAGTTLFIRKRKMKLDD